MTNKADLLALADRVEAATGPSRHLDTQIFILLEPDAQHVVGHKEGRFPRDAIYGPRSTFWEWALDESQEPPEFAPVPRYTASLDAAMMLIPAGCEWNVEGWPTPSAVHNGKTSTAWVSGAPRVFANSPALALTAASLRATAAQGDE